jgi:hypothetical protein
MTLARGVVAVSSGAFIVYMECGLPAKIEGVFGNFVPWIEARMDFLEVFVVFR